MVCFTEALALLAVDLVSHQKHKHVWKLMRGVPCPDGSALQACSQSDRWNVNVENKNPENTYHHLK